MKHSLPFSSSCYYEMVDCDETCNWWMRLWCRLTRWYREREYKG